MREDDLLLHLERTVTKIVADSDTARPGVRASLDAGGNRLSVVSAGGEADDRSLRYNDTEVLTTETLKSQAQAVLNEKSAGPVIEETETLNWAGIGSGTSPLTPVVKIPAGSDTEPGVVKVVNEGSHGYPCAGFGGTNFYAWYVGNGKYIALRNGADDLEEDVFVNYITENPFKYTASADRFRPAKLPATAKPTKIRHGTEDCVWLDTTDGPFILLTGRNPDPNTWRCLKISNTDMDLGYYGCPFTYNGKLYVVMSVMNASNAYTKLWEAPIPPTGGVVSFTTRSLSGNNHNGTPQNSTNFKQFDRMRGNLGEKAYVVSDGFFTSVSISHAGDQFDRVQKGNLVRFCHNGYLWAGNTTGSFAKWRSMSYVLDLLTGIITVDEGYFPAVLTRYNLTNVNPRPPLMCVGSNRTITACRANAKIFAFQSYGKVVNPRIGLLRNNGVDDFENARWDAQDYVSDGEADFIGMYASPVHSGVRGAFPLSGNRMVGLCVDGFRVQFKYDPNGSYGPNSKGYGPTNDRVRLFDVNLHDSLARMTWYFDGDTIRQLGTILNDLKLSNYTTYENDARGSLTSIASETLNAVKEQAISKFANDYIPNIVDSRLTLGIHRVQGVAMLAMLQIIWTVPTDTNGRKHTECFVFEIQPSNTAGVINSITIGKLVGTLTLSTTANAFAAWGNEYYSNSGVFRLNDGGHVVMLGGLGVTWVGNGGSPSFAIVYDASGNYVTRKALSTSNVIGLTWIGTKELGFGITSISSSGEGLYLDSYGRTVEEIKQSIDGVRPLDKYALVLTRTDAGGNVVVSQYAVTEVRNKIESLVPPSRKVQGMDLSQDRTITRAMLTNASKIPNQRDTTYPVQQQHRNSLAQAALKTHTHAPGDFMLEQATVDTHGASVLGGLASADATAFRVDAVKDLTDSVTALQARHTQLVKLDNSIAVDYEV